MRVSGNEFISSVVKNLALPKKKGFDERSENFTSESQRHLDEMRKMVADEARYQEGLETDRIAKKIARGESVTNEEREQLRGLDEEKLRKAEQANIQRIQISARLANATTKEQAKAILLEGKIAAGEFIEKGDQQYGELFMEAVNKAEADHYGIKQPQPDTTIGTRATKEIEKQANIFDIRL